MHTALSQALFEADTLQLTDTKALRFRWILHTVAYPIIECSFTEVNRTTLRVRLDCADWNETPPAIALMDSAGAPLECAPANPTSVFHQGPHPSTGMPFVCMPGTREYHTHSSHTGDTWEPRRTAPNYRLADILMQVWHAWLKGSS